jgi:alpha-beta hydrolase superfamily lysophospholipase
VTLRTSRRGAWIWARTTFEEEGAPPLPNAAQQGYVEHDGARVRYAAYGSGPPVILLHGGLGHSGDWGHQVPALLQSGRRVVLADSRGTGAARATGARSRTR